jgi:lysylphosphatidylglycerol synthetase-like protein (DUF2156 family)
MKGNLGPIDQVIVMLQNFGFFRVILPFLLIFAIIYAVLLKTKVLGEPDKGVAKNASAVIALVAAFLVIAYTPVVSAIATVLPQASFLILIVVLLLMVLGLFGIQFKEDTMGKFPTWILIIVIPVVVLLVAMIGAAVGPDVPILYNFTQFLVGAVPIVGEVSADTVALLVGAIIIFGIVGGVIYMVTQSGD